MVNIYINNSYKSQVDVRLLTLIMVFNFFVYNCLNINKLYK